MENYIVDWLQIDLQNGSQIDGCVVVRGMKRTKRLLKRIEGKFDNLSITISILVNNDTLKPYKNIPTWEEDLFEDVVYSDEDIDSYFEKYKWRPQRMLSLVEKGVKSE